MLCRWPAGHLDLDGLIAGGALYLLAIGPSSDSGPIGKRGVSPPQRTIEAHWFNNYQRRSFGGFKSACGADFRSLENDVS